MAEQQKTVVFGILFAVVLGIAINWWWPWNKEAETDKNDKDDKTLEVDFSVNVGVDAHVRYGAPMKSTPPTPTQVPFFSVDLRNYGISPSEFLKETTTGGNHLQYGGLELFLADSLRSWITANEGRSDYLLIFLSPDRRRIEKFQIIRNKEVLRKIKEDDIDDISVSSITDKYGNIYYIPLFTEIDEDDVEKIYVINEYVVYSKNSYTDGRNVIAVIGIIGFVLLIIGVILLILRIFGAEDIGCLWFVIGGIGALMCSFAASILGGSCCC